MATFREFCDNVKKGFSKIGNQVGKTADVASLRIKLTGIDGKLNEYYTDLGRLTYTKIAGIAGENTEREIESVVAKISGKMAEKREVEQELEKVRASMSGEKTEYEAAAEEPSEPEEPKEPEESKAIAENAEDGAES